MPIDINEYSELEEYNFSEDYIEMIEYSIQAYKDELVLEDLSIPDMSKVDMGMIDLDAVRWYKGDLTTEELYEAYRKYYMRAD